MSDIKLFRLSTTVKEIAGRSAAVEKSIQTLMEANLEAILGIRFVASEYATGKTHGGRIDTLGIDENNCPVIIEFKRSLNENVINQGLFYLDWLLDHKAEFKLLIMDRISPDAAANISWSGTRLLCIAGDFTKYDQHAVQQINRSIELIRYRNYDDDLLLLDLVNSTTATLDAGGAEPKKPSKGTYKTVGEYLSQSPQVLKDLFEELSSFLVALGDDVQVKELQFYFAFKRIKNFACVEAHPATPKLLVYVKVDPSKVELKQGFTRDVSNIGHYGTGDLEIVIRSKEDLEAAKPYLIASYEAS